MKSKVSQIWIIIPQIFYDIIARIVPGFLILIISLMWVLARIKTPINDYSDIIQKNGIYKTLNLLTSDSLISDSFILFTIILLAYFLSIIISSIWNIFKCVILNIFKGVIYLYNSTYISIFCIFTDKIIKFIEEFIENNKNIANREDTSIDIILDPQIVKLSAEIRGSETIMMSIIIIFLIEIIISLFFSDEKNISQIFSNSILFLMFLFFFITVICLFIFRLNVINYRSKIYEILKNSQSENTNNNGFSRLVIVKRIV